MDRTRRITTAALMAAVAVVLLYLAQIAPTMRLSLIAIAGIAGALVVAEYGPVWGLMSFAAAGLLSLLLSPMSAWVYVVFFGWYPAAKCLIERLNQQIPEWILKLAAFLAAFLVLWFFLPQVLAEIMPKLAGLFWVLLLAGGGAFVLFDIALSGILSYYIRVLLPKIRRK